jgi:hypothetical protein
MTAALGAPLRRHGGPIAFGVLGALAFAVLFYAGRNGTFYNDEWYFVEIEGLGTFEDWMRPWGAHWVMVPMILWRSVFAVVGLGSYLPYLALLVLLHVLAATALFILVRRASGDLFALCASAVFLFLGSAYHNLFWAFQSAFVISTAAGLWALVAFERGDRRGAVAGAALLLVSLASSGMGVPFAVAAGVELLIDRRRRRAIVWLLPVALVFATWYLGFGRDAASATEASTGRSDPITILTFIALGPAASIHALVGLGMLGEVLLYITGLLTLAILAVRRAIPPRAVGAAAGISVMLAMIAIGRGVFGVSTVEQPRYVYEGVVFILLIVSALVGRRVSLPPTTPGGAILATAVVVLTAVALIRNVAIIPGGAGVFVAHAGELRAVVSLTERYGPERLDAPIAPGRRAFVPSPSELQTFMAAHGRVDSDILRPTVVLPPTAEQRDRALWRVLGQTVEPVPASEPSGSSPPILLTAQGVTIDGACLDIRPGGSVMVELGAGEAIVIEGPGRWSIGLGHEADPQVNTVLSPTIGDGWHRVAVPDLADGIPYRLALTRAAGEARVCSE